jgi:hypothetical protein
MLRARSRLCASSPCRWRIARGKRLSAPLVDHVFCRFDLSRLESFAAGLNRGFGELHEHVDLRSLEGYEHRPGPLSRPSGLRPSSPERRHRAPRRPASSPCVRLPMSGKCMRAGLANFGQSQAAKTAG